MTANRQGPIIHGPAPIQDQHREQEAAGCCGCDKGALLRAPAAEPAPHDRGHAHDHDHDHDHQHEHIDPAQAASAVAGAAAGELRWTSLRIEAMDCPTEERLLRDALGRVPAVEDLDFNLMQRLLRVQHRFDSIEPLQKLVASLGMQAEPVAENAPAPAQPAQQKPWWPLALAGVAAAGAEFFEWFAIGPQWLVAALAIAAILGAGLPTYRKGWIALKNRNLNINALMSIAVTGAMLIGQWPEAAMVAVLFAIAELIEAKSLDRARNAIRGLLQLAPEQATVQVDGQWQEVSAKSVALGARVRVRPGERIALDGEVLDGRSSVNQAPITGESLPVEKQAGDTLFAGTINGESALEYRVTRVADDSTLARIIHAVEEAQGSRAPTQRFVDQFSRLYTPAVFLIAIATALLPPLFFGGAWLDWVYRALVLLVIACPCALVISTPVTIVSGLSAAARLGILIKGGVFLEMGRSLSWIALDKTGTLTEGRPRQTDFTALRETAAGDVRALAASLAARSDHPVSHAVAQAAEADNIALYSVGELTALPGRGVKGEIDGRTYHLGNHRLVEELELCSKELEERLDALEQQGKTVIVLLDAQGPLALFAVADGVKETSREAVAQLHELGVRTLMLTGDNPHTAAAIGAQVGIDEALGNLLPEDKLREVKQRQEGGKRVGMVGDGINDAPALARADIGFAMGAAGTDTAIETAGVALMDDDLRKLPSFIRLSRQTHRVLIQNITLALGIKAVFLTLTLAGEGTLWMAVFADMGASLLVVFNGLRLLRHRG
ncbi:heavy metal translocating P-type ATPase [Pseudomonas nitroreducens]|uniref:heavy metal translocating P-type ATPase n=1 Tax=Pseudomonas nitroreducens TaxID=46680 RepID=UPI001FB7A15A|nr:heavy metal translocating P-type ATPase [Pseudomonas nitroreducens]MCJ1879767.1 heavy metal translocating P-type ATPase [Pseudomonas nitroreducens]MCJ1896928.1 heavy metal translocating P-type ATPase [Pseudomonas nitroreducens]